MNRSLLRELGGPLPCLIYISRHHSTSFYMPFSCRWYHFYNKYIYTCIILLAYFLVMKWLLWFYIYLHHFTRPFSCNEITSIRYLPASFYMPIFLCWTYFYSLSLYPCYLIVIVIFHCCIWLQFFFWKNCGGAQNRKIYCTCIFWFTVGLHYNV